MTPVEFLGRLAILVPPPYFPLVRYHGVFAARSKWRALVTLKPPGGVALRKKKACPEGPEAAATVSEDAAAARARRARVHHGDRGRRRRRCHERAERAASATMLPVAVQGEPAAAPVPAPSAARAVAVAFGDITAMTVQHWNRLPDGALYAASSRVDWAVLLRRNHGVDAMRCRDARPRCG
jgi:hypothetical protein